MQRAVQLPRITAIVFGLASLSCTVAAPGSDGKTSLTPLQLASQAKEILRTRCFECHGGVALLGGINVMDHKSLLKRAVLVPGKPDGSPLYAAMIAKDEDVRMPRNQPPLSDVDIETIRQWILAGAPGFPTDVTGPMAETVDPSLRDVGGVDYVLKQIAKHLRSLSPDDRVNVRYFSCNHLLSAGATRDELDLQQQALAKAVNHLSREGLIARPKVIDEPTRSIYCVDLRDYGWQARPYQQARGGQKEPASLNLFDLVLLEYPYAVVYEDSDTFDALVSDYILPSGMVRPIPYLRTDWFCSIATSAPLYHDILQLPHDLDSLEKQLGVNVAEDLRSFKARRAGRAISGVSRNNRVVERHPLARGAYWKSYDYSSSKGKDNIFSDPINLHAAGGEMIFSLPNGLQAYFLATGDGQRIDFGPTQIVTDKFSEDKTVRIGLGCIRCHENGVKEMKDDVRSAVEQLPGSTGISKREVLALYPPQSELDALIREDTDRFMKAMENVLGEPQTREPLLPVTQRFIDGPLTLTAASSELGMAGTTDLQPIFRSPSFAALGLMPLSARGVVRRDLWEDYFDHVVRQLGLGIPIVNIDGLTRRDYRTTGSPLDIVLSTTKANNVFAPGEELAFLVTNNSKSPVFIELYGTGTKGEIVLLAPSSTKVNAGDSFRFPGEGALRVKPALGRELITVLACETEFPGGQILRAPNGEDRIIHPFYQLSIDGRKSVLRFDAAKIVKKSIAFETR